MENPYAPRPYTPVPISPQTAHDLTAPPTIPSQQPGQQSLTQGYLPSWGEVPGEALQNLAPNAVDIASGAASLANPLNAWDRYKAIAGAGPAIANRYGVSGGLGTLMEDFDNLATHFKQRYLTSAGLRSYAAKQPLSAIMDASLILPGSAGRLGALLGEVPTVATAAEVAEQTLGAASRAARRTASPIESPAIISRKNPTTDDIRAVMARAAHNQRSPWPEAERPIFETTPQAYRETDQIVPQRSVAADLPPLLPSGEMPLGDRFGFLRDNASVVGERMAERLAPLVASDDPMLYFYGTAPVLKGLQKYAGHSPGESVSFMRDWAGQGAATSPQTSTPPNLRNASYLLHRWAKGEPVAHSGWTPEQNVPGYGVMGMHVGLAEKMRQGTIDAWLNPKPYTFREGWSGNTADVVADMHVNRANMIEYDNAFPGQLPRAVFASDAKYERYREVGSLRAFNKLSDVFNEKSAPRKTVRGRAMLPEYPIQQLPLAHAARLLGISPGKAQSGAWFEYGSDTNLGSPPMTIPQLLNNQIEDAAKAMGVPTEKALEWWGRGKIPLSSNAPGFVPFA